MATAMPLTQPKDLDGNTDFMTRDPVLITGNATTPVFTGRGVFIGVIWWVPVDGGTMYFLDNDNQPITGLPHSTAKASTTRAGTIGLKNLYLTNGLKVVTELAAGVICTISASKME